MGLFNRQKDNKPCPILDKGFTDEDISKAVRWFRTFIRKHKGIPYASKERIISRLYRAFQYPMIDEIKKSILKAYHQNKGEELHKLFYEINPPLHPDTFKDALNMLYHEGKIEEKPLWMK